MSWLSRLFGRSPTTPDDAPMWAEQRLAPTVAETAAWGTGFSASASNIEHRRLGPELGTGRSGRQAFMPSQPVQDAALFAGRGPLLRRIIRALQDQGMHVVIYGDRGIGKTSILHVVRELAQKANYIVSYTSCGEDSDFYETFRTIAARIPLLYDAEFDPSMERVESGQTLADRLPAGNLTVAQISDVFGNVAGTRVLIILDEFDRTRSDRFRNGIAELIKNLSDRSIRVQLLIAGVSSNLTDLIAHVPSIRRNIIGVPVPNMSDEEVAELVRIGTTNGGVAIGAAALDRLVAASGGLPYVSALIGQHAALARAEDGADEIAPRHIDTAIALAAEDIGSRLSPLASYVLAQPDAMSDGSPLVALAEESVRSGGLIRAGQNVDAINALPGRAVDLVEPVEGDPYGGWRFREDGVAAYIWLQTR